MSITAIKDFRLKESYAKLIEKALWSYLWEGIYKPLFEIMQIKPEKAKNSTDVIMEALRDGKIYYTDGGFKAKDKFSNAQSLQLQKWGARWDKYQKMYRIERDKLPQQIAVTLAESQIQTKQQIKLIDDYLKEVQANMPYMVESMVFDNEVITILDDAGKEIHKNVKHLNIIEPELSSEQKREIARTYTENVRGYVIKDFAQERIPEMRRKIQEIVLQGYRPDKVQELLEKDYGVASRKAKFLAQNETSIMLAEYKKVTYKEMGFDKFIWKTIMDGKERELHKQLNNTTWSYDNPPVIDERTGQRGLPGETYNCRCEAIPFRSGSMLDPKSRTGEEASRNKITKYIDLFNKKIAKNSEDIIEWITVKGNHVPIKPGQTKEQAVKEFVKKKGKEAGTIAGVKKGRPMSFKKANQGRVNPYFTGAEDGYSYNCQTSVAVFEARLRGYDIEAKPLDFDNEQMRNLAYNPNLAYIDKETGRAPNYIRSNVENAQQCYSWLKNRIKRNERYAFIYHPIDNGNSGHIVEVTKTLTGNLNFYDPQNGRNIDKTLLNDIEYNPINGGFSPVIFRVDNQELNVELLESICKSAKEIEDD